MKSTAPSHHLCYTSGSAVTHKHPNKLSLVTHAFASFLVAGKTPPYLVDYLTELLLERFQIYVYREDS